MNPPLNRDQQLTEPPPGLLTGKKALVTGAARGIGKGIAELFAGAGADVMAVDIDDEVKRVARASSLSSGQITTRQADVSRRADMNNAVAEVVDRYGRLDIAVCNAGLVANIPFLEVEDHEWDRHIAVNLTGVFYTAQEAARRMVTAASGAILVITSVNADRPCAGSAHYSAAKAGALRLVETMALELGPMGVRVNGLGPGSVDTRLSARMLSDPKRRAEVEAQIPLRRVAQPIDIARAALFLVSDEAAYVTGINLRVDGGMLVGWSL